MLFNKPTTVTAVFEKAVRDVKVIKSAQEAKSTRLKEEQAKREEKFNSDTQFNSNSQQAAIKEASMADAVISKFSELFGIETKDA